MDRVGNEREDNEHRNERLAYDKRRVKFFRRLHFGHTVLVIPFRIKLSIEQIVKGCVN